VVQRPRDRDAGRKRRTNGRRTTDVPDKAGDLKRSDAPFKVVDIFNGADLERAKPLAEEYAAEVRRARPKPREGAEEHARLGLDKQLVRFLVEFGRYESHRDDLAEYFVWQLRVRQSVTFAVCSSGALAAGSRARTVGINGIAT